MSTDAFPTVGRKLVRFLFLNKLEKQEDWRNREPVSVDYAISAFWLFRRDLLSEVGFLDERYFYAPEDVDYCASIWLAGYRILYVPKIQAIHDAQETSRKRRLNRFTFYHVCGLLLFFAKHIYFFSAARLYRRIGRAREARSPTKIDLSSTNR
jgi:GT2 family glycosyltransferase